MHKNKIHQDFAPLCILVLLTMFFLFPALTSYSPCMLALHDMLKQQLELTKCFLHSQQALYQSMSSTLDQKYRYTTLEDTKKVHTLKVTVSEPPILDNLNK